CPVIADSPSEVTRVRGFPPGRAAAIHGVLHEELWAHTGIRIHNGKTKLWNRNGVPPLGSEVIEEETRQVDSGAVVYRGDSGLPPERRGIEVLGTPLGTPEFIRSKLRDKPAEHRTSLDRESAFPSLQSECVIFCSTPTLGATIHYASWSPAWWTTSRGRMKRRCGPTCAVCEARHHARGQRDPGIEYRGNARGTWRSRLACRATDSDSDLLGKMGRWPRDGAPAAPRRSEAVAGRVGLVCGTWLPRSCRGVHDEVGRCWVRCTDAGGACRRRETAATSDREGRTVRTKPRVAERGGTGRRRIAPTQSAVAHTCRPASDVEIAERAWSTGLLGCRVLERAHADPSAGVSCPPPSPLGVPAPVVYVFLPARPTPRPFWAPPGSMRDSRGIWPTRLGG
ncbi:hypothetical protein N9L68_07395, partial [bacterium]|nr:hypothetical protein [bacterium]